MPNALGVLVNLPDAVKRDAVDLPLDIGELKGLRAFGGKTHFLQGNQDNPILGSVVISQLKAPLGKLRIPPDPVEQFVNGKHSGFMEPDDPTSNGLSLRWLWQLDAGSPPRF